MNRDDIIRMAREAGWSDELLEVSFTAPLLDRFAALVAAHEREACAAIVLAQDVDPAFKMRIAAAVRAAGNAT